MVHFEMPYKDVKRVAEFYQKAFGWKMNKLGDEMGQYVVAETADTGADRMVKTPGTINGGFYDQSLKDASPAPSVVISVPDLKVAMKDVEAAGGKMLREPDMIPGIGLWVSFEDSEGNRVSLLQAGNPEYRKDK